MRDNSDDMVAVAHFAARLTVAGACLWALIKMSRSMWSEVQYERGYVYPGDRK